MWSCAAEKKEKTQLSWMLSNSQTNLFFSSSFRDRRRPRRFRSGLSLSWHAFIIWQRTFGSWQCRYIPFSGRMHFVSLFNSLFTDLVSQWPGFCHWAGKDISILLSISQNQRLIGLFRRNSRGSIGLSSHWHDHWSLRVHCSIQWLLSSGCQFPQKNTCHWHNS